jgi:hypothetical protein
MNMDFDSYVDKLNNLDQQEAKSVLEEFYFFNSGLLQFFKAIDNQVQVILTGSTVNPQSVELIQNQVNAVLPTLNKLKFEISMFDANTLSEAYKKKISINIEYIKNFMLVGEVNFISEQLFGLLEKNETAIALKKEQKKRIEAKREDREENEHKIDFYQPDSHNEYECVGFICNGKVLTNAIYTTFDDFKEYVIALINPFFKTEHSDHNIDSEKGLEYDIIDRTGVIASFKIDISDAYNSEDFFECITFNSFDPYPLTEYSKAKIRVERGWFDYSDPAMEADIDIHGKLSNIRKVFE